MTDTTMGYGPNGGTSHETLTMIRDSDVELRTLIDAERERV